MGGRTPGLRKAESFGIIIGKAGLHHKKSSFDCSCVQNNFVSNCTKARPRDCKELWASLSIRSSKHGEYDKLSNFDDKKRCPAGSG